MKRLILGFAVLALVGVGGTFPAQLSAGSIPLVFDAEVADEDRNGVFEFVSPDGSDLDLIAPSFTEVRATLEFDISSIPTPATITSATLSLRQTFITSPPALPVVEVHGYTGDGIATTSDAAVSNLIAGPFSGSTIDSSVTNIDVADFIQAQVDGNSNFAGFMLRNVGTDTVSFAASERGGGPSLNVEHVIIPEPSTVILLGMGAVGLLWYAWRRRRRNGMFRFRSCWAVLAVVFSLSVVVEDACGEIRYTVTDLGTLGGTFSYAAGINNSGQVVGYATGSGPRPRAFRTAANQPINPVTDDLGTLGGHSSHAQGINDSGQVVGYSLTSGNIINHAFLHSGSGPINPVTDDLGTLGGTAAPGGWSRAQGINNSGQVVGWAYTTGNAALHAFRTAANQPINPATDDLGTFGGTQSIAKAINDSGQVVGSAYTGDDVGHAFLHNGSGPLNPATDDLGTFGGTQSIATAINNSGQVVGYAQNSGSAHHAFLHNGSGPLNPATDDLGTLGGTESYATGINDSGQVVGWAHTSDSVDHAFLYIGSGSMQDLNNLILPGSGWTLVRAYGINDSAQIVGYGINPSEETHAFRLDPLPIPEPSTFILLGTGAVGLLAYALRRRRSA